MARRLIEAGARVVTLNYSKWDWHGGQNTEGRKDNSIFVREAEDFPIFDQCVSALVEDLHTRGLDKDCTVIVWGEFGRTPIISSRVGRDHWPRVNCAWICGVALFVPAPQATVRPFDSACTQSTLYGFPE